MTRILLIGGSPSHPSKAHTLLNYAKDLLENQPERQFNIPKLKINTLLVRDLLAEDLAFGRYSSPALIYPKKLIQDADGIIIVSPISKTAYTGVLKSFLDLLPRGILSHKIILPLATSNNIAHSSAIDYSLKPVLAELGATSILNSVFAVEDQLCQSNLGTSLGITVDSAVTLRLQSVLQDFIDAITTNSAKSGNKNHPELSQYPTLQEIYAI
jgi:FMN reductase